jgi:8-oxo-dGTP pyrophosphatase MutT (NUDIX family)
MGRQHGPWKIQGTTRTYHNPFLEVHEDQVTQPDGQPGLYATITMSPGVAVLAVDDAGYTHLTRQFRYALGYESLEVVSGATEADETPLEAARRELAEELGITAGAWTYLGRVDPDTAKLRSPVWLFLAESLTFTEADQEGTETILSVKLPLAEVVQQVLLSGITHAPSCVLILKAGVAGTRLGYGGAVGPRR